MRSWKKGTLLHHEAWGLCVVIQDGNSGFIHVRYFAYRPIHNKVIWVENADIKEKFVFLSSPRKEYKLIAALMGPYGEDGIQGLAFPKRIRYPRLHGIYS